MSAATKRMTSAAFLAWAEAEPGRHELIDGLAAAMAPERFAHAHVKRMIANALDRAVAAAGLPCVVVGDGVGLTIDAWTSYRPDAMMQCGATVADNALTFDTPILVVEVLSPSSLRIDHGRKLRDYFRVPSLRHYLIVDIDDRLVIHHARAEAGGPIVTQALGPEDRLALEPPGIALDIAAFFEGLRPEAEEPR